MKYLRFFSFICFFIRTLWADCSDLDYADCIYWSEYCSWDGNTQECYEVGGGGDIVYGPFNFESINEEDGLRDGPHYKNGLLYYPIEADLPYRTIIFTPGFGGGSPTMSHWGEYFASFGYISMIIGPNDEINDSHAQRAIGLLDAIQTIKEESMRNESALFNLIDTTRFVVAGYSMGGGASQIALTIESVHNNHILGAIALNPTILIEDCNVCTENEYCICLVPEFLEHSIPTLVIAGQNELNELPDYAGLLGQNIYNNTPETTVKILYEIEGGGHSSAESPTGYVGSKTLEWAQYLLMGNESSCDSLLVPPIGASQYLSTLECIGGFVYDLNEDGDVDNDDLIELVIAIINNLEIEFDIDNDHKTSIFDLLLFSQFLENR
ncbi:MAG: alpha/beta hydrolase [Candidatus Neomarinimicrobiota bacterium]